MNEYIVMLCAVNECGSIRFFDYKLCASSRDEALGRTIKRHRSENNGWNISDFRVFAVSPEVSYSVTPEEKAFLSNVGMILGKKGDNL